MSTLNILTASLDDIVFEGRNKAYGAFVLRRLYHRHLTTAVLIACSLCLLLVAVPVVVRQLWPETTLAPTVPKLIDDPLTLVDVVLPKEKTAAAAVAPAPAVVVTPPVQLIPTRVIPDEQASTPPKEEPTLEPVVGPVGPEPVALGALTGNAPGRGAVSGGTSDSGATLAPPPAKPFTYVEAMPKFAGGEEALQRFMQRNLHYPAQALANSVAGKVYVAFVVNTDGSITDVEVLKGLGYGTDEEAVRVIRKMPAWTPGRQNGHPVPVRYTFPITFRYE